MAYNVEALIARSETLKSGGETLRHARVVPLPQGLTLVPVTDELHDEIGALVAIGGDDPHPEFYKLSPTLAEFARRLSDSAPVAYFEADYFGGYGVQSAIVWEHGRVVAGPYKTGDDHALADGAINRALRRLGVVRGGAIDEFSAVSLGRYRSNEDWIAQANHGNRA